MKTWKRMLAMMLALVVLGCSVAWAEADVPSEPAAQSEAEPEPKAEVVAEAPELSVEPEIPVEPEVPAEPENPAEPEVPAEPEIVVEAGEDAQGEIEIEEPAEAPKGIAPAAPFTAHVEIELKEKGDIFFGDEITLVAKVTGANRDYDIRWEVNETGEEEDWEVIPDETEDEYEFVVTPENVDYDYRVVLTEA